MRVPVPGSSAKDSRGHETRVLREDFEGRVAECLPLFLQKRPLLGDIGEKRVEVDQVSIAHSRRRHAFA